MKYFGPGKEQAVLKVTSVENVESVQSVVKVRRVPHLEGDGDSRNLLCINKRVQDF